MTNLILSDHYPVKIEKKDINTIHESAGEKKKKIHKFSWQLNNFVDGYDEIIHEKLEKFKYSVDNISNYDYLCIYIDNKLQELSKIFLQSTRLAEDRLHKKYNKKIGF
jgi:hypothetical protein